MDKDVDFSDSWNLVRYVYLLLYVSGKVELTHWRVFHQQKEDHKHY